MAWVDWAILIVLSVSILGGLAQGFFRSACSLGGLILGLLLAAWNYSHVALMFLPMVRIEPIGNTLAFLLIVIVVTAVANLAGTLISKTVHKMGLGCLDRLAGAAFGFLQGALLITLCILVIVAFFPKTHLLSDARLPPFFFGACHLSTHMSPAELAERVRDGLSTLERESPQWMHPDNGGL